MVKLQGDRIYLGALEREDCRALFEAFEYDFEEMTEPLSIGLSMESADTWFEEIQGGQGSHHVKLGIFMQDGQVIGDIGLQEIDWKNRVCTLGMGIARTHNRVKGYGKEALELMLDYAFMNLGLERISANTLEHNIAAQRSLESVGFQLEGTMRRAVYFAGRKYDKLCYGLLREEYAGSFAKV